MHSNAARAQRFKDIRTALDMTQPEFAERLNAAARELGLEPDYTQLNVSQRETGRQYLDIEDYAVASHIDPQHRSIFWLAFGREIPWRDLGQPPRPKKR